MKILLILCIIFFSNNIYAENVESLFSAGNYSKVITLLEQANDNPDKLYYLGISYSRLQDFDKAINYFRKAITSQTKKKDIYFELGQALYATNDLKEARNAFTSSVENSFNIASSLYYIGHISQLLEDYRKAYTAYKQIIKDHPTEIKIVQIAQFQLAETMLELLKDKKASNINKYILPLLKEAETTDPTTSVVSEIKIRYQELLVQYKLDPNVLENGRRVSSRRWEASISQKLKFDDNITLSSFENELTQSKKESFIFETNAIYQYMFIYQKMFTITPQINLSYIQHSDQIHSDVFQNDAFILNLSLKNKYEHLAFNKQASLIFDIDYSKTSKDFNKVHKNEAYSKALGFSLGESLSFFNAGDSTLRFKRKEYQGTNTNINNYTYELSLDQTWAFNNQNILIFMLNGSRVDNYNYTLMNTDSYLIRLDYIMPEIFINHTLGMALAFTTTDTKQQKATRGTETTLNPSIDITRNITQAFKASLNYDFTVNKSLSTDYTYNKSIIKLELKYDF